jgi:hypothetical protein
MAFFSSSPLQGDANIQRLTELVELGDIWKMEADGSAEFRVKKEEFQEMKDYFPECKEEGSVEELVQEAERRHHESQQEDDWFKTYVSSHIYMILSVHIRTLAKGYASFEAMYVYYFRLQTGGYTHSY